MVTINGHSVRFKKDGLESGIEGLGLSRQGVEKEFPDLVGNPEWKQIAITRFKDKIKSLGSEENIKNYLIGELSKYGYIPKYIQRQGHRVEEIK